MWNDISTLWQTAFTEAWTAFKNGCIPIGAVVAGENGCIVLSDHNRGNETMVLNRKIAHAEANVLKRLDTTAFEPRRLTLYSTMEPCPMCLGTAVMSNIGQLQYAAQDPYCGFMHIRDFDAYMHRKTENYRWVGGEMEFVQLVIQSYHEMRYVENGASNSVINEFAAYNGEAVQVAEKLYASKQLDTFAENNAEFATVYDYLLKIKESIAKQ